MRCVIISNGELNNYKRAALEIRDDDYIVCADGGLKHAVQMALTPHVLIGDLDSVSDDDLSYLDDKSLKVLKYPAEKDETDTEIAIIHCLTFKPDEIVLMGVLGGRLDHTFANLGLLKELYEKGVYSWIHSDLNDIYMTDDFIEINGEPGDEISVMPISDVVEGITLTGLRYPLENRTLRFGAPIGVSNVFIGTRATIKVNKGYVMIMKVVKT